jgi:3-phosphoshikimate 1-carboxyvinyltransferase
MLAGLLAAQRFSAELTGDASLSRRPMRRVIEPLSRMGARIEATDGHAPLTIHGASLHAIAHRPDVPSAQVKSAVLLAGLYAEGKTSVTEPAQTRDHTERALAAFGLDVGTTGNTITVAGGRDAIGQPAVPVIFLRRSGWSRRPLSGSRVAIDDVGLNHANGPHRRAAPLGLGLRCTS